MVHIYFPVVLSGLGVGCVGVCPSLAVRPGSLIVKRFLSVEFEVLPCNASNLGICVVAAFEGSNNYSC